MFFFLILEANGACCCPYARLFSYCCNINANSGKEIAILRYNYLLMCDDIKKTKHSGFQKNKNILILHVYYLCNQSIFLVPQEVIFGFWLDSLLRMFYVFLRVEILHLEVETSPFEQEVGQV